MPGAFDFQRSQVRQLWREALLWKRTQSRHSAGTQWADVHQNTSPGEPHAPGAFRELWLSDPHHQRLVLRKQPTHAHTNRRYAVSHLLALQTGPLGLQHQPCTSSTEDRQRTTRRRLSELVTPRITISTFYLTLGFHRPTFLPRL